MSSTTEDVNVAMRIDALERTVDSLRRSARRSRLVAGALAALLVPLILVGANQVAQPQKLPDEIVVKKVSIVDGNGTIRIVAGTDEGGGAFIGWRDANGRRRIGAGTDKDGAAAVAWFDAGGKNRIKAAVDTDGSAAVDWFDNDGNLRIMAGTDKVGRVTLPTKDLK